MSFTVLARILPSGGIEESEEQHESHAGFGKVAHWSRMVALKSGLDPLQESRGCSREHEVSGLWRAVEQLREPRELQRRRLSRKIEE